MVNKFHLTGFVFPIEFPIFMNTMIKNISRNLFFLFLIFSGHISRSQDNVQGKVEVRCTDDFCRFYIQDKRIYTYGLDTTSQVRFWRTIIKMSPDSGIMNAASNRMMLSRMTAKEYARMSEAK
jgi:hypothetical protein